MSNFILNGNFLLKKEFDGHLHQCFFEPQEYSDLVAEQLGIGLPESLYSASISRKADFIAGRYSAQQSLAAFNLTNFPVDIGKHRQPLWPEGFCGSITHTGNMALAAVAKQDAWLGIGIDAEKVITQSQIEEIQDLIVHYNEAALLESSQASSQVLFSVLFTIKEAFFKAAYPSTGFYFDFDAIEVLKIDLQRNYFQFRLMRDLNRHMSEGKVFSGYLWRDNRFVISLISIELAN